jgi:CheY-like chemotaxis protein
MAPRRHRTILIVENEGIGLNVIASMGKALGYRVIREQGAAAGLRSLRAEVDALITDARSPAIDGSHFVYQARALLPTLPIIVVLPGHGAPSPSEHLLAAGVAAVLQKPFRFGDLKETLERVWGSEGPAPAYGLPSPRRILVVDDEASIREAFEAYLTAHGHAVALGHDGPEALRLLEQSPVDLVFLDVLLPGIQGASVLRLLRAQHGDVPVVLITGAPYHPETLAALEHGPAMLLQKPISLGDIQAALRLAFKDAD